MSLCQRWRHSDASSCARVTASTSSPFTCRIGAFSALATSVQYGDERLLRGSVVKATWRIMPHCRQNSMSKGVARGKTHLCHSATSCTACCYLYALLSFFKAERLYSPLSFMGRLLVRLIS